MSRERTTVWVLEKTIDGHFTPEAYFGSGPAANDALRTIEKWLNPDPGKWRVREYEVWMEASFYAAEAEGHTAKLLRAYMDPEYAEYKRMEAKFKEILK